MANPLDRKVSIRRVDCEACSGLGWVPWCWPGCERCAQDNECPYCAALGFAWVLKCGTELSWTLTYYPSWEMAVLAVPFARMGCMASPLDAELLALAADATAGVA